MRLNPAPMAPEFQILTEWFWRREKTQMDVAEESLIWSFGVLLLNGGLIISSIPRRNVVKLARLCVVEEMGHACVILGFFVGIERLVDRNLVSAG